MNVGTFKGRITPLNLTEILKFLKESGKTGLLGVDSDGLGKGIYVRRGRVIAVDSSASAESILTMLEDAGRITSEQAASSSALVSGGMRPGRALVEMKVLTPAELWEWTERRVRVVVRNVLGWDSGSFAFEEGLLPAADWMLVDLDILDVILIALRDLEQADLLASRMPESGAVFEIHTYSQGGEIPPLLPYERYVLGLVNGRRTAAEVARLSEIGDAATKKVLALLFLVGCVRHRREETVEGTALPEDDSVNDVRGIIRSYNEMFAYLYGYMIQEVGPIAEHVLDKYLREVREGNQNLFQRITLNKDGTLNEESLARNVHLVRGKARREVLISGLNEFLYSALLAVKRTLGADHEGVVVRRLKEIRKAPASLG